MMNDPDIQLLQTELIKIMRRIRKVRLSVLSEQVIYSEYIALDYIDRYIREHPGAIGIYVSELASSMEVAPSAVSRMLKTMEGKDLVARKVDEKDRRNIYVCLTDGGRQVLESTSQHMDEMRNRLIERMGREDLLKLIGMWNNLATIMEEEAEAILGQNRKEEGDQA